MNEIDPTPEPENEPLSADQPVDDSISDVTVEVSADDSGAEVPADPETTQAEDWSLGDIDAALAAVASLSDLMPEREAEAEARADSRQSGLSFVPEMPMPPLATLKRGQLGSVVPALLLIGFGAWLTLTTTGGAPPDPPLVAAVVVGGLVLTLLAQWLGAGRWSRGVVFFAVLIVLGAGVIVFSTQPGGLDLGRGYPLLIVAAGLSMAAAGFLARPISPRLIAPGALMLVAGLTGLVITLDVLPDDLLALASPLAPVVLGIALVLFLLPVIFRRRSR